MKAAQSTELPKSIYLGTQHHIPENSNP